MASPSEPTPNIGLQLAQRLLTAEHKVVRRVVCDTCPHRQPKRCTATHPETNAQCGLPEGHDQGMCPTDHSTGREGRVWRTGDTAQTCKPERV